MSPKWAISIWLTLDNLVTHGKLLRAKMSSNGIKWKRWVPLNKPFCIVLYLKISCGAGLGPCCGLGVPLMGHISITDPCRSLKWNISSKDIVTKWLPLKMSIYRVLHQKIPILAYLGPYVPLWPIPYGTFSISLTLVPTNGYPSTAK